MTTLREALDKLHNWTRQKCGCLVDQHGCRIVGCKEHAQ